MKNTMRIAGIVLLALFALVVGAPLLLAATMGIVLGVFGLVVVVIKLAVVVAIGYLLLVGFRAMLR